jgi:hypothetical protein
MVGSIVVVYGDLDLEFEEAFSMRWMADFD